MDRVQEAVESFGQGFNCAQAILRKFGPGLGLDAGVGGLLGACFGGGVVRSGDTCGAVIGSLMVLGLRYGNREPGDKEAKERAYVMGREFLERFSAQCGSVICRDLLGCDLGRPGGLEYAREKGLFEKTCPALVASAAGILESLLEIS